MSRPFPFSFWKAGFFDPATLDLTGWWRAGDYDGSAIWTSSASAGTSGLAARSSSGAGASAPTNTGPVLKGHQTVQFNGGGDSLALQNAASSDFVTTTQWSYSGLLFMQDTGSDLSGSAWVNPPGLGDNGFGFNIGFGRSPGGSTTTGRFRCEDNNGGNGPLSDLFSFGGWLSIQARYQKAPANVMEIRIGNAAFVQKANPSTLSLGTHFAIGNCNGGNTFKGFIADQMISQQFFDTPTLDLIRASYYAGRYGVSV